MQNWPLVARTKKTAPSRTRERADRNAVSPAISPLGERPLTLSEDRLHPFLRRRRRRQGVVEVPPIGPFLAETLDLARKLVPCEGGSILLDNPTVRQKRLQSPLTFVASFGSAADHLVGLEVPPGKGIAGHVYQRGVTYVSVDATVDNKVYRLLTESGTTFRTKSIVAVPVKLEQAVCGVLELVNRRGNRGFTDRDVALTELLAQYISRAILNAVDILKQNELAYEDELTGTRNVRALDSHLEHAVRHADEHESDVAVLFVDVDRLKRLNDQRGHRMGSEALRRTGHALTQGVGEHGAVFRFGGDEFVVVCPSTHLGEAKTLAERLRKEVWTETKGPVRDEGALPSVSISIGVATLRQSLGSENKELSLSERAARLLSAADRALYVAKNRGRGRVCAVTVPEKAKPSKPTKPTKPTKPSKPTAKRHK